MLRTVIESFIPPHLAADTEYYRRTRLVAYTLFVTAVFTFFYVATSLVAGYVQGMFIMAACLAGFVVLLLLLRRGVSVLKITNAFGAIGAAGIFGCIYFSGGFQSPVLPWLATTPIVILLLAGKRSGFFWAAVCVLMVVFFGFMDSHGYAFPVGYAPSRKFFFFLSCHAGLPLIIFLISLVFENVRLRAHNEISKQKEAVEKTLSKLKAAQAQLIQSERLASLGELTAGIAHEIQNPLNFVNNFAEVNKEMIEELQTELKAGNTEEAIAISNEIKENEEKISQHGKRAEAIVKGMLQHSRKDAGKRAPTDINKLADEYLRLSFHGLRAKDKSFNADFKTHFDENIGKVAVVPQDIGRVLLNLYNNAFYAVHERLKKLGGDYKPLVTVTTKKQGDKIAITVKDNGMGISKSVQDKIFQPFFTTKPTGQGTGLGLSLSYDIIKAHGGTLTVQSNKDEGATFVIILPG